MNLLQHSFRSLFLTVFMLMLSIATMAHNLTVNGIYYTTLSGNNVEVSYKGSSFTAYDNEYSGDIIIPATVTYGGKEYTVTGIGKYAFYSCEGLKSIVLPEGLKYIDYSAFSMCDELESITLPQSLESIGNAAFFYCEKLKRLEIPKNVSSIDTEIITYAKNIEEFIVDIDNGYYTAIDGVLFTKDMSNLIICNGVKQGSYTIPESVTTIAEYAFEGCKKLTSVTIPANVNNISGRAFWNCNNLGEIHINAVNPPTIAENAFSEYKATIFVPANSIENYKKANIWKNFSEFYALGTIVKGSKIVVDDITYLVTETNSEAYVTYQGVNQWYDNNYSGNIIIPESFEYNNFTFKVTGIAPYAFNNCKNIESIYIPASIDSIGDNAFNSTDLKSIQINENNLKYKAQNNMILTKDMLSLLFCIPNENGKTIIPDGVKYVANNAFGYKAIDTLVVPESIEIFGTSVVDAINSLEWNAINCSDTNFPFGDHGNQFTTSVTFGNKVEHIPAGLCCYMTALTSIKLPESLKSIGARAFMGCKGITEITIPEGVTLTAGELFEYCDNLNKIIWNAINCSVDGYIFGQSGNEHTNSIIFGDKVEFIPKGLCYRLTALTEVEIPESVKKIGNEAFDACLNLVKADLPKGLKEIGNSAFRSCGVLDTKLPEGLETIGKSAFSHCGSLKNIELPSSIKSIGEQAFYACKGITEIVIPEGVTHIENQVFYNTSIKSVKWNAINCTGTLSVTPFPDSVESFVFGENVEYIPSYICSKLEKITSIVIPKKVKEIGNDAFSRCSGIDKIEIPNSVTKIGEYAFANMNLITDIVVPSSVKELGAGAFNSCTALKKITLPENITVMPAGVLGSTAIESINIPKGVTKIERNAFNGCNNLVNVKLNEGLTEIDERAFYNSGVKNIAFPSTLRTIGNSSFYNTKIEELFLPETIDSVALRAFSNCKNLKKVEWCITNNFDYSYSPFIDCDSLEAFVFGKNVKYIGKNFIPSNNIKSITIGGDTFLSNLKDCSGIETLIIPNISNITTDIVGNYDKLKKLDISNAKNISSNLLKDKADIAELILPFIGCGEIGTATNENGVLGSIFSTSSNSKMRAVTQYYNNDNSRTYYVSPKLEKITITDGATELSYGALYGISTLKEVTLPASIYMVGEKALYGCAGLEHIYCNGASPAACFDNSFMGVRTATCILHVPHNSTDLYSRSNGWKDFFYIQAEEPITISVSSNIQKAGIILGITEYKKGDTASIRAVANKGYKFVAWVENNAEVCLSDTYEFKVEENRNILALFAPVANENSIKIAPAATKIDFTWEIEDGVDRYTLTIYSDADKQNIIETIFFDENGEVIETRANKSVSYTIENLLSGTTYYYELKGTYNNRIVISESEGYFTTDSYNNIDNAHQSAVKINYNPYYGYIVIEGNICEKDIRIYSIDGIMIQEVVASSEKEIVYINNLPAGVYIIWAGNHSEIVIKL